MSTLSTDYSNFWIMLNYSKLSLHQIAHDLWERTNIINSNSKYTALNLIQKKTELTCGQCEIVYRLMIKLESNVTY